MHINPSKKLRFGDCVALTMLGLLALLSINLRAQLPTFWTPYVTRAEAVMILLQARVNNVPALQSNSEFIDVKKGEWYERYIVVGERLGIIQADPKTRRVRPDDPVTRAEFVAMVAKTFGINGYLFPGHYRDVSADQWYAEYVGISQQFRLFPADPDPTLLRPNAFLIHTEVAKAVWILTTVMTGATAQNAPIVPKNRVTWVLQNGVPKQIVMETEPVHNAPSVPSSPDDSFSWTDIIPFPTISNSPLPVIRSAIISMVNKARREAYVPELEENLLLTQSAQKYAEQMASEGFFSHTSPSGETLKDRMVASGYYHPAFNASCLCFERYVLGENLASGQRTPQQVMDEWMRSQSHRDAIVNPVFTDIGVGIQAGIWVEHFGGKVK